MNNRNRFGGHASVTSRLNPLKRAWLRLDPFGTPMIFNYGEGGTSSTYRSSVGACLNILFLFITLVYTIQQTQVMFNYTGTTFTTVMLENELSSDYSYTEENGFRLAVAIFDSAEIGMPRFGEELAEEDLLTIEVG